MKAPHECAHLAAPHRSKHCPVCFAPLIEIKKEIDDLQAEMKYYFDALYKAQILVHHNNNQTNKVQGAKAKRLGVRKSMPDFQVLTDSGSFFIEVKLPGKKLDPEQIKMKATLEGLGYRVYTATTLLQFILICKMEIKR